MFLALAHMVGATQVMGLGWGGVGMITFFELAHVVGATQQHVPCTCTHGRCYASHGIGVGWGGDDNVLWTCTRGRCYTTACSLHLHTWSVLHNSMFLALKKHRSLASRSFLSPSQVFKQPLWQVWEKRSHVLMKDKIFFPTKNEMIYFSSHYIHLFKMQRREIISYTLIVVCFLERELFPKCLSMFM